MNIVVLLKMVPDVVEELEIAPDSKSLDTTYLRMILNDSDNHALEEALLLKERHGGKVCLLAPDAPEVDDTLFAALAKGADRAVKIAGVDAAEGTRALVVRIVQALSTADLLPADLILTGAQAIDDLDGLVAPLLAQSLRWSHLSVVNQVRFDASTGVTTVTKEFPGGLRAEFEIRLPAVLGIQSAEKPPRYVPVAKVRAAMKSQQIDSITVPVAAGMPTLEIQSMIKPSAAGHAEMLEGLPEAVAGKLCDVLAAHGLL